MKLINEIESILEKIDIFSVGNPDKKLKGMKIKDAVAKYDFKDDVSPVINDKDIIVGLIFDSDGDEEFMGTPISDLGLEDIKGTSVYRI